MPLCTNCGSYYIRPPCPACEELQVGEPEAPPVIPASARRGAVDEEVPPEQTHPPIVKPVPVDAGASARLVEELKTQVREKNFEIRQLKNVLQKIKADVDKQVGNMED